MEAWHLITKARAKAGLSQRALAKRAGTSAAAICNYERASQVPRFDTLVRIIEAAGGELACDLRWPDRTAIDPYRNARVLRDVLDLAGRLPARHARRLPYPPFAKTVAAG